jgi:hypothetical protein
MSSLTAGRGVTSLKTGLTSLRTGVTSLSTLRKGGWSWILATRFWRDIGVWNDSTAWRD